MTGFSNLWPSTRTTVISHQPQYYSSILPDVKIRCVYYIVFALFLVFFISETTVYTPPLERLGGRGRPTFSITEAQLRFLLSCGFRLRQMAEILNVSVRTLRRRMRYLKQSSDKGKKILYKIQRKKKNSEHKWLF